MKNKIRFNNIMKEMMRIYERDFETIYMVRCSWDDKSYNKFKKSIYHYSDCINELVEKFTKGMKDNNSDLHNSSLYSGWYEDYIEYIEECEYEYILRDFGRFVLSIKRMEDFKILMWEEIVYK